MNKAHDVGVARQIGEYSDAIETPVGARWLYTSGTPGIAPADVKALAEFAWQHSTSRACSTLPA